MRNIREFFAKIQNAQAKEVLLRTIVHDAVKKAADIDVPIENIRFKGLKASLSGLSSAERAEIFIKKTAILREIALQSPSRTVADIV